MGLSWESTDSTQALERPLVIYNNGETEVLSKNSASTGSDQVALRTRSSEGLPDCRGKLFIFWIGVFLEMTRMECKQPIQLNEV